MAAASEHIALARRLHPRLLYFFKRFPPPAIASTTSSSIPPQPQSETIQVASNTSSTDPNEPNTETLTVPPSTLHSSTEENVWKKNPFLPFKNPHTGNWHGPHYSLRRQADLFKLAKKQGVLSLMPLSPKHPEVKEAKRIEQGLRVKGTGVGQKVKGKYWERTMRSKLDLRRKAMEVMPDLINAWRLAGHGKGWRKYPRGKPNADDVFHPDLAHAWAKPPGSKGRR